MSNPLYAGIYDWDNLLLAHRKASRGKRATVETPRRGVSTIPHAGASVQHAGASPQHAGIAGLAEAHHQE